MTFTVVWLWFSEPSSGVPHDGQKGSGRSISLWQLGHFIFSKFIKSYFKEGSSCSSLSAVPITYPSET